MHWIDPSQLVSGLVTMAIGGAASWLSVHIMRFARDLNAAFSKIRKLEDEVFGKDRDTKL